MVNREELLKDIQDNYNEKKLDEMGKQQASQMARIFTFTTLIVIVITVVTNFLLKNNSAIFENAWIGFITCGVAGQYIDRKNEKKMLLLFDYGCIVLGFFCYILYIVAMMGK